MPQILTKAQINHLLDVYANQGYRAARELAPTYGIKPGYVQKLAYNHGVRVKRNDRSYPKYPSHLDPRWERAKLIGAIVV